jgi:2-polyprenyl-3-methyl-5-hydroxy-6-metoxy-1,4-benzoquinol methylase
LDDLKTLGGTELNTTFAKTFDVDCGTGKYIYIAYPTSISGEPFFKIGGLDFTNLVETTAEITNEYGLKVNYNIRRVFDIQTTRKTVVVTKK